MSEGAFPLPAWRQRTRGEQRWEVSIAVAPMIALQLRLPGSLSPLNRWILPGIELAIIVVLVWAKLAMMLQSSVSLVTAALVIARAVNVLK